MLIVGEKSMNESDIRFWAFPSSTEVGLGLVIPLDVSSSPGINDLYKGFCADTVYKMCYIRC